MRRRFPRPIILTFPTFNPKPRILPFPAVAEKKTPAPVAEETRASDAELREVRERLFRMIVSNQWDRSNGNRAS